ncbi:MAG: very short patch repair endonuclease [Verrucomicrobia bacterium]|jgi:DNA mismatch endonuclease (patch repair protein)|nr:very short patch repair endonuclease [Verrucomicrobiota bacterium]
MADVFSTKLRSEIMSRIRSKGNRATEQRLRSLMLKWGISGWRRNEAVFGKPDFVFRKSRLAVFVDGCFWHGCPRHATRPRSNQHFWSKKISRNKVRDRLVTKTLRASGWRVLRIWQHELGVKKESRVIARIRKALDG